MKILFTMTPAFNPNDGGVQSTTFNLGKRFTEFGYEVFYFSTTNEGHIIPKSGQLFYGSERGGENNSKNIDKLVKILKEVRPNFVINQMPYVAPLRNALYANKVKYGYVLLGCLHNSLFSFKNNVKNRLKQQLPAYLYPLSKNIPVQAIALWRHKVRHSADLKKILDAHDRFIMLTPPNRKELNYFVGDYKKERVISIPNSIPSIHRGKMVKEKIILHVGRINVQQKRSDLLLDFWEACYEKLPDWKFVIVGDGPYKSTLDADLAKRKLPRVSLEGYQKPTPYYLKAPIFMMPSAYEGFPMTLLEAQSFGCVSAVFNSYFALDWIVNDDKDTILVQPFDIKMMVNRIVELANDEVKMEKMREATFSNVERFTADTVGNIWKSLFENFEK